MALAGDLFQSAERNKALGLLEAANGIGKVVAPILGSAAGLLAWYAPFFVYPLLAWQSAAAVGFLAQEPPKDRLQRQPLKSHLGQVASAWKAARWPLLYSFFAGLVALFLLFGVLSHYSDVLEARWRVRGLAKGLVMAVPLLGMAAATLLAGVLLQRDEWRLRRLLLAGGFALTAGSLAAAAVSRGSLPYAAGMAGLGTGISLALPTLNALVTGVTGAGTRGIVTALYGMVRLVGAALGPPAAARLTEVWPQGVNLGAAALAAVAATLALPPSMVRHGRSAGDPRGRDRP